MQGESGGEVRCARCGYSQRGLAADRCPECGRQAFEPASALDPAARERLQGLLTRWKKRGLAIVISSHILPDLAAIADAVGIMERGRMVQSTSVIGATDYRIDALGQRIRKTNSLGDTVFHYDTSGRLIAESDPGGAVKREIFHLGDIPVGVVQ